MDQPPFDVLTLDKSNDNKVYKVYPVPLPERRVPEKPKLSEKLRVKLMESGEEYDVAWQNIEKLDLYEQMVLAEARKFTTDGKLDDAYDTLQFLIGFYPRTPGLPEVRQSFLFASSGAAFRQQKFDEALAILQELYALNPNFKSGDSPLTLLQRLGVVADRLIAGHVEKKDYQAARTLLSRLSRQYKAEGEPFAKKWRDELTGLAKKHFEEARAHFEAGSFVQAHDAASQVQVVWPDLAGARELVRQLTSNHPLVRVGVEHPARALDVRSLTDPAARRAGRLRARLFVEQTSLGLEGGTYHSPIATLSKGDDGLSLSFRLLDQAAADDYKIAQHLVAQAVADHSGYDAGWSRMIAAIDLPTPGEVQLRFRKLPLLPEARLQFPLADCVEVADAAYAALETSGDSTRFARREGYAFWQPGQPAEVLERHFSDPQRALLALKRGEIDVLDRVFPGDIGSLRNDPSLVVAAYARPTAHVLIPQSSDPYLATATFRRALLYASNRELLLNQGLLRGATIPGCRVISSPFPAAAPGIETPAYGYDEQIDPRAFDARLGMALVLLAEGEVKSAFQKQERPAPKRAALTLGHPADEMSRIACRGLVKDWKRIGVECKLNEFSPGVFADTQGQCDLVYAQLSAWEPLLDAQRLFGTEGLVPASAAAIKLTLREIENARNWQEARRRMTTLHRLIHEDVTVLPLWQTIDHFAYRPGTVNLSARRLHLYQDIETWRPGSTAGSPP